jgi:hypothetical protein
MAFDVFKVGDTFKAEVKHNVTLEDGTRQDITFTAIFERMEQTEIQELNEAIRHYRAVLLAIEDGREPPSAAKGVQSVDYVFIANRVLQGWGDDMLYDEEPWKFDEDSKRQVIQFPGMAQAIADAWTESTAPETGKKSSSRPTSGKSRGNGIGK